MDRLRFHCRHQFPSGFILDAEFEASDGITGLCGPSGSGKTTTLAIIAGTLRPKQGVVRLGERVLVDTARGIVLPPEQRQVGCVFQDLRLFPHLTVEQNLRYGLNRRPARKIAFSRVVEILELGELLDRSPRTLSGGQKQRTALARAVLQGPKLLLLDEPLTALDAQLKERIVVYLERMLAELRIPTVLVSHDLGDVRRLAERVVMLAAGRAVSGGAAVTETRTQGRPI
jgi:molybdate transport system ATP-binding protein